MTTATITRSGGSIIGYEIKGHTGYAEEGSDIVCAAISAIAQTALGGLTDVVGIRPKYEISENPALLRVAIPDGAPDSAQVILETMLVGLSSIQITHPEHLRIVQLERR